MNQNESEWVTGNVRLNLNGHPVDMQMTVPARPVKPHRMLPVLQKMTDAFVDLAVGASDGTVSCRKGCGACCSQVVPLAVIETYRIAEVVEAMPESERTAVRERFEDAFRHFASIGWFERLNECASMSVADRERVFLDYFAENIPCPFLVDDSCSIHADRPLACREYLVTSPAENCREPSAKSIRRIEVPVKPSEPARRLGHTRPIAGVDFVPLVVALRWAERNEDAFAEKTGEQWMAEFFGHLTGSKPPAPASGNATN